MAALDAHDKSVHCREKTLCQGPLVLGELCEICDALMDAQKDSLSTLISNSNLTFIALNLH